MRSLPFSETAISIEKPTTRGTRTTAMTVVSRFEREQRYRANCDSDWLFYGPPRCQRGSGSHKVRYSITVRELLRAAMAFQAPASTPANFVPSPRSPVILSPIDRPNNSSLFHPLLFVLARASGLLATRLSHRYLAKNSIVTQYSMET